MSARHVIHLGQLYVGSVGDVAERIRTETWVGVLDKSFTPLYTGMRLGYKLNQLGFEVADNRAQMPDSTVINKHFKVLDGVQARAEVLRWYRSDARSAIAEAQRHLHPRDPLFRITLKRSRGESKVTVLEGLTQAAAWVCCLGTRADPWECVCCLAMEADDIPGPIFTAPPRYYLKTIRKDGELVSRGAQRSSHSVPKHWLRQRFQFAGVQ